MFRTVLTAALISLGTAGCNSEAPTRQDAPTQVDPAVAVTSGLGAAENFIETWNTRDPEIWASSLNFPHARPSAGRHRVSQTKGDYVANVDYASVIATGWDRTEFEDLRLIHEGDTKARVAGRWGRLDAAGNTIRRNLVTYIATEVDGKWGIQARFGAGPPLPEGQGRPIADIAIAKVEEYMTAFNARDPMAWAATLNYPHLRIASAEVRVWETEGSPDIKVGRSPGRSDQELCDLGRNRLIHGFFWDLPEQYFLASVDGRLRRPRSGWGACSAAAKSRRKVFNLWLLLDDRWAGDTAQVEPVR